MSTRTETTKTTPAVAAILDTPAARRTKLADAMVDEWGLESFPASDPPANW